MSRLSYAGTPSTRRQFLRRAARLLTAIGGARLLAGCVQADNSQRALTPFTVLTVQPMESLTFAPELVAQAMGLFAALGLECAFEPTRGSSQAIQLLAAGRGHLGRVGQIEVAKHVSERDIPIVVVASLLKRSTIRFVSDAAAPLRAPTDFRGKVFGLPSIGGESEITLDLCLAASGVDPGSVERQIVGIGAAVFSLVKEGRIAGYAVSMDMANLLKEQDVNTVVFNPRDFIAAGGQVYATLDVGMKEAVAIRSYLTAIKASVRYILDDASSRYQNVLNLLRSKYSFNGLDNDLVARHSLDEYGQVWLADGPSNVLRTVSTSWREGYDELVGVGQAAPGKEPSRWYTNDLVPLDRESNVAGKR